MKTKQGFTYWMQGGKYTVDGYDLFDTLEELEADCDWQLAWADGKAFKDETGWHRIAA